MELKVTSLESVPDIFLKRKHALNSCSSNTKDILSLSPSCIVEVCNALWVMLLPYLLLLHGNLL